MTENRARQSLFDVVRQVSQTDEKAPSMRSIDISRSSSDVANLRRRSKRWSQSSNIIFRVTKAIQRVHVHDDRVMQIIRLECPFPERSRFLAVVCNEKAKEYCLLGVDCANEKGESEKRADRRASEEGLAGVNVTKEATETIGLVMKLSANTIPQFTGDGGFKIKYKKRSFLFKPVSLQALWKLIQTLHMISERICPASRPGSSGHTRTASTSSITQEHLTAIPETTIQDIAEYPWIKDYENMINSPQCCINYWERFEDILSKRPPSNPKINNKSIDAVDSKSSKLYDGKDAETAIRVKLRRIMRHVDLDRITSRSIRKQLESEMGEKLDKYRTFIDEEILVVLGQLDQSSKILDYMYLGSEWNASNFDELKENKITHVLNVTREIDNFYPGSFKYKNIRVWDLESTYLVPHFDETYRFIKEAKDQNGIVLVHCKMGMSRSASSVIAFLMKEYEMNNEDALEKVRKDRPIIQPNDSFARQLVEYNGILNAKLEYRKSLSAPKPRGGSPNDYSRKKSAQDRCRNVDVKKLAGSRFSYPVEVSESEEDVLYRQRSDSVNTKK